MIEKKEWIGAVLVGASLFLFYNVNGMLNVAAITLSPFAFEALLDKSLFYTLLGLILTAAGFYYFRGLPKTEIVKFGRIAGYIGILFGVLCLLNIILFYQNL